MGNPKLHRRKATSSYHMPQTTERSLSIKLDSSRSHTHTPHTCVRPAIQSRTTCALGIWPYVYTVTDVTWVAVAWVERYIMIQRRACPPTPLGRTTGTSLRKSKVALIGHDVEPHTCPRVQGICCYLSPTLTENTSQQTHQCQRLESMLLGRVLLYVVARQEASPPSWKKS